MTNETNHIMPEGFVGWDKDNKKFIVEVYWNEDLEGLKKYNRPQLVKHLTEKVTVYIHSMFFPMEEQTDKKEALRKQMCAGTITMEEYLAAKKELSPFC